MATLIRIDKNGTKYWHSNKCPKCGGSGHIYGYEHVEGGMCFKCRGTGMGSQTWKEYTPEYAAKLAERRLAKARAKAPELNRKFLLKNGFNEDGITYVVLGDTYKIKEELKAAGAKFNPFLRWHFTSKNDTYPCIKVSIEEIAEKTNEDLWSIDDYYAMDYIENLLKKNAPKTNSDYIGNIGDTIELKVTLEKIHTYETHYSYYGELNFIYKFSDKDGNTLVWKTSGKDIEEGQEFIIKGKIKEHSEYKGDKQTVLTRCKIKASY